MGASGGLVPCGARGVARNMRHISGSPLLSTMAAEVLGSFSIVHMWNDDKAH